MRRDLNLIRKMVLAIEDGPSGWAPRLSFDGYTKTQIEYHEYLLIDAGLAHGSYAITEGSAGPVASVQLLTWAGHEFAAAARDDTRWKKAMGIVTEKGGSITLDVLKQLLTKLMEVAFGLS